MVRTKRTVPPEYLHQAIQRAYDRGITIVSITGNTGGDATYPGNYPEVIAVSATSKYRNRAHFSGRGDQNDICAPGQGLYGIKPYTPNLSSGH